MKRRLNSSPPLEEGSCVANMRNIAVDVSASSSDDHFITKRATEEYVTDALVKFFMQKNFSVVSDFMEDPNFRKFLERVNKYGFPLSLLRGDCLVVEKSLMNIKEEVFQHMLMVKDSWKTTGCTFMVFNLKQCKGSFSSPEKDKYVFGFYSPKGFIFIEAPYPLPSDPREVLKRHSPSLDFDDVTNFIYHSEDKYPGEDFCELSDRSSSSWITEVARDHRSHTNQFPCVRHEIKGLCIDICKRSTWAQRLLLTARQMHRALLSSCDLTDCYYKILKEKGFEGLGSGKNATPLSRFLGIMFMEDELKQWLLGHLSHQGVPDATRQTPDYGKFWDDGRQLKREISLILKISDLMDTLVPVAGYLEWPLDEAKHLLYTADFREPTTLEDSDNAFWRYVNFHSKHHLLIKSRVAAYLNPVCILKANLQEKHQLQSKLKLMLPYLVRDDEREEVDQQLQRYSDECSNLFGYIDGLENYHPVKLWEQYGHELPVLRKYAIKMLSQPVSCMCNQVKKHLFQLEGAADCILRLNVRMMEEFRALGDDIYKPFNLEELEKIDLDSIFAISNYDISDCYVSSLKSIRF